MLESVVVAAAVLRLVCEDARELGHAELARLVAFQLLSRPLFRFLHLLHLFVKCKFDVHHCDQTLVVRAGHQVKGFEFVDARERQRLASFINLRNQVADPRDVFL